MIDLLARETEPIRSELAHLYRRAKAFAHYLVGGAIILCVPPFILFLLKPAITALPFASEGTVGMLIGLWLIVGLWLCNVYSRRFK